MMHRHSNPALLITTLFPGLAMAGSPAPAPAPQPMSPAVLLQTGNIGISRMNVTTQRRDGEWTADVTSHVTLDYVRYQPFTYEASLVDAKGNVHTDKRGRPYTASREVSTGDHEDTDKYTVTIPLTGLFSSRPPAELFIRARILDKSNNVLAISIPESFTPPKD